MKNGKLISLLKSFNPSEIKELRKFLLKNALEKEFQLADLFFKYHPNYDSDSLSKKKLFPEFFPNEDRFKDYRIRRLMSELTKRIEDFVIHQRFKNSDYERNMLLNRIYAEKNLNTLFKKNTTSIDKINRENQIKDTDYYFNEFEIWNRYYTYYLEDKRNSRIVLDKALSALDKFYASQRMKIECEYKNRLSVYPENPDYDKKPQISDFISQNPATSILSKIMSLYESFDLNLFNVTQTELWKNRKILSVKDKKLLLAYLLNLTIKQVNSPGKASHKEVLQLYEIGLKTGVLLENGVLTHFTFNNITMAATILKDFRRAKKYISDYGNLIDENTREATKTLALANIEFFRGNHDKVINLLSNPDHPDINFKIHAKTLKLRSYYEMFLSDETYLSLLDSQISAFKRFIERNKLLKKKRKKPFLNFIFITGKLIEINLQNTNQDEAKKLLTEKIKDYMPIYGKQWLEGKLKA